MSHRLLFVSSPMPDPGMIATALARKYGPGDWQVEYASDTRAAINDVTARVLEDEGLTPPTDLPHHPNELQTQQYDAVVTFCESSVKLCPTFSGLPARFHWPLDELVKCENPPSEECIRELYEQLDTRVRALFRYGSLEVVNQLRSTFGALIDHLMDGVLAHDHKRRIFVFNKAAEEITGYKAEEIIGQDCHEVFPGLFCGGHCTFCTGHENGGDKLNYPTKFIGKDGSMLDLEMSAVTIRTPDRRYRGSMVIFKDITEVNRLKRTLQRSKGFQGIIGQTHAMERVFTSIDELADENIPVLIQGESGTGKELVAEALHRLSARRDHPFVPVNCGALPEGIIESELFGHVKGAFTGAIRDKKGRFELARGGTLFLDEIGEISPTLQVKLLRVLEDKMYTPVGGEATVQADVRLVFATNRDLREEVRQGNFREDLFYRISVVPIDLPPVRERREDVELLVQYFLEQFSNETGRSCAGVAPETLDVLKAHPWPGNVRQLANAVQFALIKCRGTVIEPQHLPPEIRHPEAGLVLPGAVGSAAVVEERSTPSRSAGRPQKLDADEVREALARHDGNRAKAARDLGVARSTLYRYLDELVD